MVAMSPREVMWHLVPLLKTLRGGMGNKDSPRMKGTNDNNVVICHLVATLLLATWQLGICCIVVAGARSYGDVALPRDSCMVVVDDACGWCWPMVMVSTRGWQ